MTSQNTPSPIRTKLSPAACSRQQQHHEDCSSSHVWSSDEEEGGAGNEQQQRRKAAAVAAAEMMHELSEANRDNHCDQEEEEAVTTDGILKKKNMKRDGIHLPRLRSRRRRRENQQEKLYNDDNDDDDASFATSTSEEEDRNDGDDDDDDAQADPLSAVAGDWSTNRVGDEHAVAAADGAVQLMTEHDIAMCQALDLEYERALEDRQVAWTARYQSVRQSTLLSVLFMLLLILTGTTFFLHQADSYWSVSEGLLFSIYTITTVGYGHLDMPDTAVFQLYTIFYIFLGIAMLTMLVAQVYQCLALEASRVATSAGDELSTRQQRKNNNNNSSNMRLWLEARMREQQQQQQAIQRQHQQQQQLQQRQNGGEPSDYDEPSSDSNNSNNNAAAAAEAIYPFDPDHYWDWADVAAWLLHRWDALRNFLRHNEFGRGLSVVFPFVALIAIGAGVIGPLEGWTPIEATYFAVVSLTTVGFGDYYPTRTASIWFCCLWLPFSVGFMSLYLANVAAFYIRLSDRNVARIERVLRRRLQRAKERAEHERRAVLRRAMRGQQQRSQESSQSSGLSADEVALATEAAEAARRPLEIEEGVTIVTVDHGVKVAATKGLRQTANRLRGFNTIPTLDDSGSNRDGTALARPNLDGLFAESESQQQQGANGSSHLFGTDGSTSHRRERILQNSLKHIEFAPKDGGNGRKQQRAAMTMTTMKDVLRTVHRNNSFRRVASFGSNDQSGHGNGGLNGSNHSSPKINFKSAGPEAEFLSVRSSRTVLHPDRMTVRKKPSFALRALVQERFAEIIATDIAGFQSSIEIKEYTLAVTIQSLKETADKWLVPRRARKAFRAVAFEALYFVGEHGLITRGADALFSLTPFEFHQIFSLLLAAFGDAETMEQWLEQTQTLADVDLSPSEQLRLITPAAGHPRADRNNAAALKSAPPAQHRSEKGNVVASRSSHPAAKTQSTVSASMPSYPDANEQEGLPDIS